MASFEARNALKLAMRMIQAQEDGMKRGGRLLQDQYPSKYMPGVGRQVMARGGEPEAPPMPSMPEAPADLQAGAPAPMPTDEAKGDFGSHPAHGIPGIHIVGHDPVFTGER